MFDTITTMNLIWQQKRKPYFFHNFYMLLIGLYVSPPVELTLSISLVEYVFQSTENANKRKRSPL